MSNNELNPLYRTLVGFDRIASLMDQAARLDATPGYPPFNIEQIGEDAFRIELAVAGFGPDDLTIEFKQNSLTVSGARSSQRRDPPIPPSRHRRAQFRTPLRPCRSRPRRGREA